MTLVDLRRRIESRQATLGVVGLGYVGLPVACVFASAGFHVTGVDIQPERVAVINSGRSPIEGNEPGLAALLKEMIYDGRLTATTNYRDLAQVEVIVISVETPIDPDNTPHFEALKAACTSLGAVLREGALVIIESTVVPGAMDNIVRPVLEQTTGLRVNSGFYLGHCPERVMPGRLLVNLRTMSRVVGGMTPETADVMVALYRHIVQASLDPVDCVTAELVKTVENAYRDVQIAFANEVALICETVGGNVWNVRDLVNKSPGRSMLLPGAGVGGHCIPKDPWLLAYGAKDSKTPLNLIPAARVVNAAMPYHMVDLLQEALRRAGRSVGGSRILVLGYAYLEDSGDARNSPSEVLVNRLRLLGADVVVHDPYIRKFQSATVPEAGQNADAVVLMVAHGVYKGLDLHMLVSIMRTPVLVDGRHVFDSHTARAAGFVYAGVGEGVVS